MLPQSSKGPAGYPAGYGQPPALEAHYTQISPVDPIFAVSLGSAPTCIMSTMCKHIRNSLLVAGYAPLVGWER